MDNSDKNNFLNREFQLKNLVKHLDLKKFDAREIINQYREMSFSSRDLARAYDIYLKSLLDEDCSVILCLAGSTSAGGLMNMWRDMAENNMIDAVVATGASIIDMDFFEAIGFKHFKAPLTSERPNDFELRQLMIDRIYDTYIDENDLQKCDDLIFQIANKLDAGIYSSRKFIKELGRFLSQKENGNFSYKEGGSLIETCFAKDIPIFCPAFSDSSAGFGLVKHQVENIKQGKPYLSIDSVADFRELTELKINCNTTSLLIVGGGVPKNFAQDTVVCAEILGKEVDMHKYAVQFTVADQRDGACSSSTLQEACSWGKVDIAYEQMVYGEASALLPLMASAAYHELREMNYNRKARKLASLL